MGEKRGTKALELWCKRMVEDYDVKIDNMTTSWKDGIGFCALVCKCLSLKQISNELIHFEQLKKENIYQNNELAFRVAEELLNIPSLLDPADMVTYDTPDKLSILTYLSQFYQVFGAQENLLRLSKRSSSEANKSSPSTSTSSATPPKMAYVPKREPCVKCNNPVFFAERLVIEEQLYHRTCFKCARCASVLTLGNFYQTEKDNEFCCETCPDEEVSSSKANNNKEANRLSIAQRIALFERETSSVLKKSLSDEEKSKSLSRQLQSSATSQGLSKFLSAQIDDSPKQKESDDEEKTVDSSSDDDDSDDNEIIKQPVVATDHQAQVENVVPIKNDNQVHENEKPQTTTTVIPSESHKIEIINDSYDIFNSVDDEIEREFEKLAEEAVSTINHPPKQIPSTVAIESSPNKSESIEVSEISLKPEDKSEISIQLETASEISVKSEPVSEISTNITAESEISIKLEEESTDQTKSIIKEEEEEESIEVKHEEVEIKPTTTDPEYPDDLNPFGDDGVESNSIKRPSLNPFGSCSEDEDDKNVKSLSKFGTLPPPRPPPPRSKPTSTNPFGSDDEEEQPVIRTKTPVPTPRRFMPSLTPEPSTRNCSPAQSFKGSTSSLASSSDGTARRRKKKPAPPPPILDVAKSDNPLLNKTPAATPKKKRLAPTPPHSSTPFPSKIEDTHYVTANDSIVTNPESLPPSNESSLLTSDVTDITTDDNESQRRLIPLEESLMEEASTSNSSASKSEEVTYRRKIIPLSESNGEDEGENAEILKDNKEAENRHRQSQCSLSDSMPYLNKSSHGKWKRRKGPAPALPGFAQPQKRVLQMLPLQEIRHELEVIEVQQQGLEKQGVMLEKMIRERCEGSGDNRTTEELLESLPTSKNPKEADELILQLFEIVNEKNELFRRQAELMYLRRAHRLEEEQADVEFEIRTLMARPECNKTDSDKTREEALIARLVDIVQLRNEIVDCLEMDRLREAEEDLSIKQRMESHTAKLDEEYLNQTPTKLSKKEKKKLKEAKKMKNKKLADADKDLDTSELKGESTEKKKKKKKFLF